MKNKTVRTKLGIRFISMATAMMLMAASITACGSSAEQVSVQETASSEAEDDTLQSFLEQQAGFSGSSDSTGKEEVVYVLADASGNTNQIIVSDWLKNGGADSTITDSSNLTDIVNVSGDESYEKDADGNLVWNANGNDIHYQGTTDAELPVDVSISYKLDGQDISPEELAGKSGKVTIRFDYDNHEKKTVTIDNQEREIYVPFTMLSGALLDTDHFRNIEVTNGRVINTGTGTVVVGMAFPGLAQSIRFDEMKDDLEDEKIQNATIPDYVEITAETVDFRMDQTMTMAFSDVLSSLNLDSELNLDTGMLTDSMDQLSDASVQLSDGSKQLNEGADALQTGAKTLAEKSVELNDGAVQLKDGVTQLANGAGDLVDGANQLNQGAGDLQNGINQVNAGAAQLNAGAVQLDTGAGDLQSGAKQLVDGTAQLKTGADNLFSGVNELKSGAGDLKSGIDQVKTGADGLKSGSTQLAGGLQQVDAALSGQQSSIQMLKQTANNLNDIMSDAGTSSSITTSDLRSYLEASVSAASIGVSAASQARDAANAAREAIPEGEDTTAADAAVAAAQSAYDNAVAAYTAAQSSLDALGDQEQQMQASQDITSQVSVMAQGLSAGLDSVYTSMYGDGGLAPTITALSAGATQVAGGIDSIAAGAGQLQSGAGQLTGGIDQVLTGAGQLSSGAGQLSGGATALYDGTVKLKSGTADLAKGTGDLQDGTGKLADGAGTLKEGTEKLSQGTVTLQNGTAQLSDGTEKLQSGTAQFVDGTAALYDGTLSLSDGTKELMEGMFRFKEDGIDNLTALFGNDVQSVVDTLNAVMEAGSDYKIFSESSADTDSSVKFIYKTEPIKL